MTSFKYKKKESEELYSKKKLKLIEFGLRNYFWNKLKSATYYLLHSYLHEEFVGIWW